MARQPSTAHRVLSLIIKPLIAALLVSLLFKSYFQSSPNPQKDAHPHISKALIVASTRSSNLTWLSSVPKHWTPYVYTADDPSAQLTVPVNKGNEAMVILTYILDHWEALPDVMFFHHDHAQAWHQAFTSVYELTHLNAASALKDGYLSPRCLGGCENVIELPGDVVPLAELNDKTERHVQIATVLHEFLRDDEGRRVKVPSKIASPCCAQFVVSRERVRARGRETWEGLREWLRRTEMSSVSSGRVLEYTWHLWFGMEPVL